MSPIKVDVRIISATNKNLAEEVASGAFREDLYYRLKVVTIKAPSLRERKDDIPLLVNAFLKQSNEENNKNIDRIGSEVMDRLMNYNWPGNIRELKNLIESMVVMSTSGKIELADLPVNMIDMESTQPANVVHAGMSMEEIEKEAIRKTLEETNGNRTRAAEILKIGLRTLHRKIQKYGLSEADR